MLLVSHGDRDRADDEEQLHAILTSGRHIAEKTAWLSKLPAMYQDNAQYRDAP
jgi:hypothetical protein